MLGRCAFLYRTSLAAALLAFVPHVVLAQLAPSRSGSSTESTLTPEEYWEAVRDFGRCFVHRTPAHAFTLLSTIPGSRQEGAVITVLMRGDVTCLGDVSRMRFRSQHIRGAFAEGLIRNGTPIPARLALAAPAAGTPVHTIHEAARCYTAPHGAEVRALVTETRPGSPQERTAIVRMFPDFLHCVPPEARNLQFDATDLRYVLAEALLRMGPTAPAAAP
jgi:hypothetical protein